MAWRGGAVGGAPGDTRVTVSRCWPQAGRWLATNLGAEFQEKSREQRKSFSLKHTFCVSRPLAAPKFPPFRNLNSAPQRGVLEREGSTGNNYRAGGWVRNNPRSHASALPVPCGSLAQQLRFSFLESIPKLFAHFLWKFGTPRVRAELSDLQKTYDSEYFRKYSFSKSR